MLYVFLNQPNLDIFKSLWDLSPILGLMGALLVWGIWKLEKQQTFFYDPEKGLISLKDKQIKELADKKDLEVKELNTYIRENDKENLEVLSALNNTMDNLIQNINSSNISLKEKIVTEATNLKSHIDLKVTELKNKNI